MVRRRPHPDTAQCPSRAALARTRVSVNVSRLGCKREVESPSEFPELTVRHRRRSCPNSLDPLEPSEEQIGGNSEILPESFREFLADSTFPADHVRSVAARTEDFEQVPLLHAALFHEET